MDQNRPTALHPTAAIADPIQPISARRNVRRYPDGDCPGCMNCEATAPPDVCRAS